MTRTNGYCVLAFIAGCACTLLGVGVADLPAAAPGGVASYKDHLSSSDAWVRKREGREPEHFVLVDGEMTLGGSETKSGKDYTVSMFLGCGGSIVGPFRMSDSKGQIMFDLDPGKSLMTTEAAASFCGENK